MSEYYAREMRKDGKVENLTEQLELHVWAAIQVKIIKRR